MTSVISTQAAAKLPDGPKIPAIIQTILALMDQFGSLERNYQKYGDIFYTPKSSLFPAFVALSDPKAVEKVLTANPRLFEVGKQSSLAVRVLLGDNSLVLLDGIEHQKRRKLLMPPFHGERMKSYGQTIVDVTKEVMAQWQEGKSFSIRDYTQQISLRVILRTVFGLDEGERYARLEKILTAWLNIFNSPFNAFFLFFPVLQKDFGAWTPWGQFVEQKRLIHEILQSEIERRRHNPDSLGEDILSLLLSVEDEEGQPMSDTEIKDELMTMLFAGHETTANTLAWAFYWIHYRPEIYQKLLAELNSLDENADFNAINKLPYLNAVVSETLRLYPVVPFLSRQLKEPFEIMGYQFEAGTALLPCIYLIHQREDIYPQPKQFKPERFLEKQFSPYEYLPFGGGHRRCLGYAFALFEMKLVLATVLSQVHLELPFQRPPKAIRRGITFAPSGGLKMRLKKQV
ncbi:cytochrome P450 [Gloeothece verrucosa]|uniref:Cytochrome P450 n=1 Tax=Gloeothece verrucosa (strain PCC 7822) TaxID=497965 RepID=E0UG83_GLOV7|nr:cytochrome P450 [Gloeothece verrucosa]ADN15584.1 cytochrome P450 [Gloeothece verrucosa PCC 7822]